jgi:hypothetical protein
MAKIPYYPLDEWDIPIPILSQCHPNATSKHEMSQNQAKKTRVGSKTILYSPQTKNTLSCAMSQLKRLNTESI